MKLSLGNQRYEEFKTINSDPERALDVRVSQIIVIISDLISTIIFFCFLVYWKIKSD